MASFYAELRVDGQVIPVLLCTYGAHQGTGQRGRVSTKVRYEPMQLRLPTGPWTTLLRAWAFDSHKRHRVDLVFLAASGDRALETLHLPGAYCVYYGEEFIQGDVTTGSYVCNLTLSDPDGFTIQPGGPGTFVTPAARDHGGPPVAALVGAAVAAIAVAANPDIPPHLPAPIPNPSPEHAQVHLSKAEWASLIKGRWDGSKQAKGKKFLKEHRNTEFHVAGDPFTYRTDQQGKMVAVYDAQKSYNVTGSKNGLIAIPLTLNGEPTYAGTSHMFPVTGNQRNVVVIDMVGNRPGDFKAANKAAGLDGLVAAQGRDPDQAPKGYTWHHRDDFNPQAPPNPPYGTCTMELVKTEAHEDTFVHRGACDQCNKHNKKPNRKKLYV